MASFVVKAAPRPEGADRLQFDEKTMWRGKHICPGDEVFIFAAEHNGGRGLFARGVVTDAHSARGQSRQSDGEAYGNRHPALRPCRTGPFRDLLDASPESEIDHKLYRQATNKIAGVSNAAAAFLRGFF